MYFTDLYAVHPARVSFFSMKARVLCEGTVAGRELRNSVPRFFPSPAGWFRLPSHRHDLQNISEEVICIQGTALSSPPTNRLCLDKPVTQLASFASQAHYLVYQSQSRKDKLSEYTPLLIK